MQVIEPGAGQVDRTRECRRIDRNACRLADRVFAACTGTRNSAAGAAGNTRGCTILRRCLPGGGLRRLLGGLLRLGNGAFALDLRIDIEELPGNKDQHGECNRHEIIAVVFHHSSLEPAFAGRLAFCLLSMRSQRLVLICSNGAVSRSRLATMT